MLLQKLNMAEFKLIEKLLYKSEQNDIGAELLIGNETLGASQKVVARFLETVFKIYQSISLK